MKGQRIGYVRVSSVDQNTDRQLDGIELDRVFADKASGKNAGDRPQLQELLGYAREGDTIIVHSIDRLARNLDDLRRLVNDLTSRGVRIQFVKETLTFSGDDSPMSRLLLSMMGAFAEFERAIIRERQREGIEKAKKKGVYKGRKRVLTPLQAEELRALAVPGVSRTALAKKFGISRESVYRYLAA
ncbi:MAG: recombinase family protein [Syntrophorhabdaceae bacterium]|nr:recombinase family protein [Syntrophorhabdaceae bacterium]